MIGKKWVLGFKDRSYVDNSCSFTLLGNESILFVLKKLRKI